MRKFVLVLTALLLCVTPLPAWASTFNLDISKGNIVINVVTFTGHNSSGTDISRSYNPSTDDFCITGTTDVNTVNINSGATANITLQDIDIDVHAMSGASAFIIWSGATVTLTLNGTTNKLKGDDGGIYSISDKELTINGTGTLVAEGIGAGACGIYADGNITIDGGKVEATGTGTASFGIDAKNIAISGGEVEATGTNFGINSNTGNIDINGGTVTAVGATQALSVTGAGSVIPPNAYNWTASASNTGNPVTDSGTFPGKAITNFNDYKYVKIETLDSYVLTITAGQGGSISMGASGSYAAGSVIDIAAAPNSVHSGYTFSGWTSSKGGTFGDASKTATTFTMPANDVTITANFELGGGNLNNRGGNNNNGGGNNKGGGDGGKKGGGGGCDAMAANAGVGIFGLLALAWALRRKK